MTKVQLGQLAIDIQLDLQISDAGLVNFVFTRWLRPTYAGQKYATFA